MANRCLLSASRLDDFKAYLVEQGAEIQEPKGDFEVLRAVIYGRKHPVIVYRRDHNNGGGAAITHLSLLDRDVSIVRRYIRDRRCRNELRAELVGVE